MQWIEVNTENFYATGCGQLIELPQSVSKCFYVSVCLMCRPENIFQIRPKISAAHILPVQMNYNVKSVASLLDASHSFNGEMNYSALPCTPICNHIFQFSFLSIMNSCQRYKIDEIFFFKKKMANFLHKWLIYLYFLLLIFGKNAHSVFMRWVIVYLINIVQQTFSHSKRKTFEIIV